MGLGALSSASIGLNDEEILERLLALNIDLLQQFLHCNISLAHGLLLNKWRGGKTLPIVDMVTSKGSSVYFVQGVEST